MFKKLRKVVIATIIMLMLSTTATFAATINTIAGFQAEVARNMILRNTKFTVNYTGDTHALWNDFSNIVEGAYLPNDYLHWSFSKMSMEGRSTNSGSSTIFTTVYLDTAEQEAYVNNQVPIILSQIVTTNMTDIQKVKAIYNWMTKNVTYDYTLKKYSGYDALIGNAVCQGYALLTTKMLNFLAIPNHIVVGTIQGKSHAWNQFKVDGSWYYLDATWGAGGAQANYFGGSDATQISKTYVWVKSDYPSAGKTYNYNSIPAASARGPIVIKPAVVVANAAAIAKASYTKVLLNATEKVVLAEKYKTNAYVVSAVDAIVPLKSSSDAVKLNARLNVVRAAIYKVKLLAATNAVNQAEKYKKAVYVTRARTYIKTLVPLYHTTKLLVIRVNRIKVH